LVVVSRSMAVCSSTPERYFTTFCQTSPAMWRLRSDRTIGGSTWRCSTVAADVGHWPAIEAPQAVVDAVNVLHR
jgi:hypothetical protein